MKAICKQNTARTLDLKEVTTLFSNEYTYDLELGKEYTIMGLVIYKDSNCLYYLVDEHGRPSWVPYRLFEISDNSLPQNWYVEVLEKNLSGDIFYLSGFYELCNQDDFYDLLAERDPKALEIYFKRKFEIENNRS